MPQADYKSVTRTEVTREECLKNLTCWQNANVSGAQLGKSNVDVGTEESRISDAQLQARTLERGSGLPSRCLIGISAAPLTCRSCVGAGTCAASPRKELNAALQAVKLSVAS